ASQVPSGVLIDTSRSTTCSAAAAGKTEPARPAATEMATKSRRDNSGADGLPVCGSGDAVMSGAPRGKGFGGGGVTPEAKAAFGVRPHGRETPSPARTSGAERLGVIAQMPLRSVMAMKDDRLIEMRVFRAVVEAGSFTGAAHSLCTSQP